MIEYRFFPDTTRSVKTGCALLIDLFYEVHTCALLDNKKVKCWGYGPYLGLGGTTTHGLSPKTMGDALPYVDIGADVLDIAAGTYSSCVLTYERRVRSCKPNHCLFGSAQLLPCV